VALQLRKHGIRPVRPLLGGFYEWKRLGFPLSDPMDGEETTPSSLTGLEGAQL
jgi:3-mercaptopyruvate sulfurtransferase SseA